MRKKVPVSSAQLIRCLKTKLDRLDATLSSNLWNWGNRLFCGAGVLILADLDFFGLAKKKVCWLTFFYLILGAKMCKNVPIKKAFEDQKIDVIGQTDRLCRFFLFLEALLSWAFNCLIWDEFKRPKNVHSNYQIHPFRPLQHQPADPPIVRMSVVVSRSECFLKRI